MIEGEGVREHAMPTDQAVGRLQPDQAAKRSRIADRAAGVAAERAEHEAGGDRGARTAARAAGDMRRVPRVARRRPGQIEGRAAMGEFVGRELAHQHAAGGAQLGGRGRVARRDMTLPRFRMAGRRQPLGVVDVLEAVRNTMQRPARAARHDLGLGTLRLGQRGFGRQGDEGVELRLRLLDAGERIAHQLDRRDLLARDPAGRFGDRRNHHDLPAAQERK